MLSLGIRKMLILSLVGGIFLLGNVWLVVNWLDNAGVVDWARHVRSEYLTGTAITIIAALLILLVGPRSKSAGWARRCPVCDHRLFGRGTYCSECGSNAS